MGGFFFFLESRGNQLDGQVGRYEKQNAARVFFRRETESRGFSLRGFSGAVCSPFQEGGDSSIRSLRETAGGRTPCILCRLGREAPAEASLSLPGEALMAVGPPPPSPGPPQPPPPHWWLLRHTGKAGAFRVRLALLRVLASPITSSRTLDK